MSARIKYHSESDNVGLGLDGELKPTDIRSSCLAIFGLYTVGASYICFGSTPPWSWKEPTSRSEVVQFSPILSPKLVEEVRKLRRKTDDRLIFQMRMSLEIYWTQPVHSVLLNFMRRWESQQFSLCWFWPAPAAYPQVRFWPSPSSEQCAFHFLLGQILCVYHPATAWELAWWRIGFHSYLDHCSPCSLRLLQCASEKGVFHLRIYPHI